MISRSLLLAAAASLLLTVSPGSTHAQAGAKAAPAAAIKPLPFLSPIFGDNMVLQRGKANTLWGWSEPGDSVRVQIGENTASAIAGAHRRGEVRIQPPPAGGPKVRTSTNQRGASEWGIESEGPQRTVEKTGKLPRIFRLTSAGFYGSLLLWSSGMRIR